MGALLRLNVELAADSLEFGFVFVFGQVTSEGLASVFGDDEVGGFRAGGRSGNFRRSRDRSYGQLFVYTRNFGQVLFVNDFLTLDLRNRRDDVLVRLVLRLGLAFSFRNQAVGVHPDIRVVRERLLKRLPGRVALQEADKRACTRIE